MENFLEILRHGRRLQSATKSLSDNELRSVIEKLENIIEQRIKKRLDAQQAEEEKRKKIELIYQQMEDAGLDISDFQTPDGQFMPAKSRQKRKVKFSIGDESGKQVNWSGVGKMPRVFAKAIENGHKLEEFRVDKHEL